MRPVNLLYSIVVAASLIGPLSSLNPLGNAAAQSPLPKGFRLESLITSYETVSRDKDPIQAGIDGDRKALQRLTDVSLQAQKNHNAQIDALIARHRVIDPQFLAPEERLDYDLLGFTLGQYKLLAPLDLARIPFTNDSGFYTRITSIARFGLFETEEDYNAYLKRLSNLPRFFDQHIANMQRGIETSYTAPMDIMPGVISSIESLTAIAARKHPLAAPFFDMPDRISAQAQARILKEGAEVMDTQVMPAYRKLLAFMELEYQPNARPAAGLSSLQNGTEHYSALVKYYTTLDVTPDQVHTIGLTEVSRIRREMDAIIKRTGFNGTFKEFLSFLRTDPQFYAKTPDELLNKASYIAKRVDGLMPKYFGLLPRLPYGISAVPKELERNYTTGRYFSGNLKHGKAGNYVVNTYALDQRPLYNLPALTLHEAVPGHHHQISLAMEQNDVPAFRQSLYPHAFGEGWGLYAEKLGVEMGIYETPYEDFGRLTYEMWRACRLIMDTGLHSMGWSREQAEQCLRENTALSERNIRSETERYISWPGQALSYKMGELKILELRKFAENELGPKFDLADFHDAVLVDGALPLGILDVKIKDWVRRRKSQP